MCFVSPTGGEFPKVGSKHHGQRTSVRRWPNLVFRYILR